MVSISIFDVDSQNNEVPLVTLQSGEHILGRGFFSNCTDKRISRNHAVIKIEDNQATLKSVHVNPCYYMSHSEPKVQILTKNQPVELNDGDKFAFLSDIWYRIKIVTDGSDTPTVNVTSVSTIPVLNKDSSVTAVASSSGTKVSNATSPIKRSLEELNNEGRKKLKTINESLDQLIESINEIKNQDYVNKSGSDIKKDDTDDVTTNEVFRKKDISDSDDDSDVDMPEVTRDTEIVTNIESSKPEEQEKVSSDSDEDNIKSDEEVGSSNVQEIVKKDSTNESSEVTETKDEPVESAVKKAEPTSNIDGVEEAASGSSCADHEDTKEDLKREQGDAADASSSASGISIGNKLRREQCWYGGSCFRKNSSHRDALSHPGDDDYDPDPNDDRPECSYGASCYRGNQLHRRQYRHPTSRPAPKPSLERTRRKATPGTSTEYSDTGDDDEEPFTADESSSENYDVEDSDSDFSESEAFDGEDNSEEMKIMFKEAKKFLRKKR